MYYICQQTRHSKFLYMRSCSRGPEPNLELALKAGDHVPAKAEVPPCGRVEGKKDNKTSQDLVAFA